MLPFIISSIPLDDKKQFYTRLYKRFYPVMKHQAIKFVGDSPALDDIIQDALASLLKYYDTLKALDEAPLAAYIILTVKSQAILYLRGKGRLEERISFGDYQDFADEAADPHTPESSYIKGEEHESKIRAIQRLPAAARDLLLYKYVLELPNAELAKIYGTTETNIRQMLSRTRRKLCRLLEGS